MTLQIANTPLVGSSPVATPGGCATPSALPIPSPFVASKASLSGRGSIYVIKGRSMKEPARRYLKSLGYTEKANHRGTRYNPDAGPKIGFSYTMKGCPGFYLAFRRTEDIFRGGDETISGAIRAGTAAWAIDMAHITKFANEGIGWAGILNHETNEFWISPIADWQDPLITSSMDNSRRGGSAQHYMLYTRFKQRGHLL